MIIIKVGAKILSSVVLLSSFYMPVSMVGPWNSKTNNAQPPLKELVEALAAAGENLEGSKMERYLYLTLESTQSVCIAVPGSEVLSWLSCLSKSNFAVTALIFAEGKIITAVIFKSFQEVEYVSKNCMLFCDLYVCFLM